jgi:hypothetical protein
VAALAKLVSPLRTTNRPESICGRSTLIAPLKKKVALLSSADPANSSTLNGPSPLSPSRIAVPCSTPTLKLSKVA